MPNNTATVRSSSTLNNEETDLLARWAARCASGTFSQNVVGTREVRVFGRSGDTPVHLPRITSLEVLDVLEPDERFALQYAERVVLAHQARGRHIIATRRGAQVPGEIVKKWDPTDERDLLILSPIAGG